MSASACAKCGGKDIRVSTPNMHRGALRVTRFRTARLEDRVCLDCGFVETFVADLAKWRPIMAENLPRAGRAGSR